MKWILCYFAVLAAARGASLELSNYIAQAGFTNATWGIHVETANSRQVLFSYNADKLLKPASNTKLFTGALVLSELGTDYRISTSIYSKKGPDASGTLHGDLVIYGRGDPSFAARFNNGDYSKSLLPIVQVITNLGIKRVTGSLIGETSFFNAPSIPEGWAHDDLQYYYGAEISSLSVEDNVIDLLFRPGDEKGDKAFVEHRPRTDYIKFINETITGASNSPVTIFVERKNNTVFLRGNMPLDKASYVDATTVENPAGLFLELLQRKLRDARVRIRKPPKIIASRFTTNNLMELASVKSPPMREVVAKMMKPSQNLYAHLLYLQVGAQQGPGRTDHAALKALRKFLNEQEIDSREVLLDEGSGLSRSALVTPRSIVSLLQKMSGQKTADAFYKSLPIAGREGTLRKRFKETPAEGNLRAKTGSLRHVSTLSGFCTNSAGLPLVFSIMLNAYQPGEGEPTAREAVDAAALKLISSGSSNN